MSCLQAEAYGLELAAMNPNTYSEDDTLSPTAVGAIAGAATAATVLFLIVMVPSTVGAFQTPEMAGWLVVIVLGTLFWAFVAAVGGAVAGGFAAKTSKLLNGTLIGVVTSVPFAIAIFIWAGDRPSGMLFLLVFGAIVGGSSGFAGALAGRRARRNRELGSDHQSS
jgi:hypothetical protein